MNDAVIDRAVALAVMCCCVCLSSLVPFAGTALALEGREYTYEDNVKDFLASGMLNLEKGALAEAQIDFENVLAIDPGNAVALRRLIEVYTKRGEKSLALNSLKAAARLEDFDKKVLAELEAKARALPDTAGKEGGRGADRGGAAGSAPSQVSGTGKSAPKAAGATGSSAAAADEKHGGRDGSPPSSASSGDGSASGGVTEGAKGRAEGGAGRDASSVNRRSVKDMSPREKFRYAIRFKKKIDADTAAGLPLDRKLQAKAIVLFVKALLEDPSVLAENDQGLLELSRRYYTRKLEDNPDNASYHFFVAHFHEIYSEYEAAKKEFRKAADLAGASSRMAAVAGKRIAALERKIRQKKEQEAIARRQVEAEKRKERLRKIAAGKAGDVKDAAEYAKRGKEKYSAWSKKRSDELLSEAEAWFKGAIAIDDKVPEYHYSLALVLLERATLGDGSFRDKARRCLERCLELKPGADLEKNARALLKGLSQGKGEGGRSAEKGGGKGKERYRRRGFRP